MKNYDHFCCTELTIMDEQISTQPTQSDLPEVEVLPKKETPASRPVSARSVSSTRSVTTSRAKSILMSKYTINSYYSYRVNTILKIIQVMYSYLLQGRYVLGCVHLYVYLSTYLFICLLYCCIGFYILRVISPYTTGLKVLFDPSD